MRPLRLAELQRQLLLHPHDPRGWEQLESVLKKGEGHPIAELEAQGPAEILWGPLPAQQERKAPILPPLKRLFYDGSSLTPLIGNLYSREPSGKSWIRWVGPEPVLTIRFPFQADVKRWCFEVEIARFFDENDGSKLSFQVNGIGIPLAWAGSNIYRAEIEGRLVDQSLSGDPGTGFSVMKLSIPSSYQPDGEDQRMLSFAIRQLSMRSLEVQS